MKNFNEYIGGTRTSQGSLDFLSEEEQLKLIYTDPHNIKYISNPSEKLQLEAINKNCCVIFYIKNPSEQVQLESVKQNPCMLLYILDKGIIPSKQVQLEAVKKGSYIIYYIENPPEQVQLSAVKIGGHNIAFINNPSKLTQLESVKQDINNIFYIKNPYPEVDFYCITKNPDLLKTEEKFMVKGQRLPFDYFKNLSLETQSMLVKYNKIFTILIPNLHPNLKNSLHNLKNMGLL